MADTDSSDDSEVPQVTRSGRTVRKKGRKRVELKDEVMEEEEMEMKADPSRPFCELCKKSFALRSGLHKHLRKQHAVVTEDSTKQCECYHEECRSKGVRFRNSGDYRTHLEQHHNVKGITVAQEIVFDTFEQVQTWKAEQERKDMSKFVQFCSVTKTKTSIAWRYRCNRSGSYVSQSSGKRRAKRQGSCKSGHRCPATLIVVLKDNKYHVTYHSMHYGHEKMLCHLNLGPAERQRIAGLMADGVPDEEILLNIRQAGDSEFNRTHLLTRKDLNNIRRAYGLKSVEIEKEKAAPAVPVDDSLGIHNWIQEMKNLGCDNPVLAYKPRGEEIPGFGKDDFLLIIMNPLQRKVLQKFGQDRICIDTTYGTTGNEFELTTMIVVDDYQEGFPVAFMLSSLPTKENLVILFNFIKTSIGVINTSCFISDDVPAVYAAWVSVMGMVEKRLSYTQHVEKSIRERCDVTSADNRQAVQRPLRACYTELRDIKAKHVAIGASKKIDKCIDALFTFLLSKQFNRLTKLHKGKLSTKLASMIQCHMEGETLVSSCVPLENNQWLIHSGATYYKAFQVSLTADHECSEACSVVCRLCKCCLSGMSCSCDDYAVPNNICKHMHTACIYSGKSYTNTGLYTDELISSEVNEETQFYLNTLRTNCRPHKYETILKFTEEIETLTTREMEIEGKSLVEIVTHLRAARDLLLKERDRKYVRGFLNSKGTIENNVYLPSRRSKKSCAMAKSEPKSPSGELQISSDNIQHTSAADLSDLRQLSMLASGIVQGISQEGIITSGPTAVKNLSEEITILEFPAISDHATAVSVEDGSIFVSSSGRSHSSLALILETVAQARMSVDDNLVIASSDSLTDVHVEYAIQLLHSQFPGVLGLESSKLYQMGGRFTSQISIESVIVQIHSSGPGHWVTTTRGLGEDYVTLYDPFLVYDVLRKPELRTDVQVQIAQLYPTLDKEIKLLLPEISLTQSLEQTDSALYAIACAVDICCGHRPYEYMYKLDELKSHLFNCFQQQRFEKFPATPVSKVNLFSMYCIPVYCVCRSIADNDAMVKCWQCQEMFHCRCVQYKEGNFRCEKCVKTLALSQFPNHLIISSNNIIT